MLLIVFKKAKSPYKGAVKYVKVSEAGASKVIEEYEQEGYEVIKIHATIN